MQFRPKVFLPGKTNTSEFTLTYDTDNLIWGRTNNPYILSHSPGGSRGGGRPLLQPEALPLTLAVIMAAVFDFRPIVAGLQP